MIFNSSTFLLFFFVVVTIYFLLPYRAKWIFLLAASYYFYMSWKPGYALLIAISTIITYFTGIKMGQKPVQKNRLKYLILSIVLNLCLLGTFKYFNFFSLSLHAVLSRFNLLYDAAELKIILPVGISFYTFQALSYSIDVYRGDKKPEHHFGIYALYVSFFPQLVAGPIERSTRLLAQFFRKHEFDYDRVVSGLRLMGWGFFKKVVVADRLAIIVNPIYDDPQQYHGITLIIATFFFAYQIYCDFSGYSDIAIGSARVLGYDLIKNFNQPYLSKSIPDFWRRWHISLSTWFRDYVYIPLGGNRVGKWRWYWNIIIVFLLSGLWHGANWTFVIWGLLHGIYMLCSVWSQKLRSKIIILAGMNRFPKLQSTIQVLITFSLVCSAWVLFRAESLNDAAYIYRSAFSGTRHFLFSFYDIAYLKSLFGQLGVTQNELFIAIISIGVLEIVQFIKNQRKLKSWFKLQPVWLRWTAYYILFGIILFYGSFNSAQEFIYFQF